MVNSKEIVQKFYGDNDKIEIEDFIEKQILELVEEASRKVVSKTDIEKIFLCIVIITATNFNTRCF